MMNDHDYNDTVPAYVLGALEPEEAAAFEERMAHDETLRAEVTIYQQVVAELPLVAPPVRPPDALKARLMAQVTATPARTAPVITPVIAPAASAEPLRAPLPRRRRAWPMMAAFGALLLLVALGVSLFTTNSQLQAANRANSQLATQLADSQRALDDLRRVQQETAARLDDARRREAELVAQVDANQAELARIRREIATNQQLVGFLSAGNLATRDLQPASDAVSARGAMYMRPGQRDAVVVVSGLPDLAPGQTYQFWLAKDGAPSQVNAGILVIGDNGNGQLVLQAPEAVNDFTQVMITVEQEQRAPTPSDMTVLSGTL